MNEDDVRLAVSRIHETVKRNTRRIAEIEDAIRNLQEMDQKHIQSILDLVKVMRIHLGSYFPHTGDDYIGQDSSNPEDNPTGQDNDIPTGVDPDRR